MRCVPLRNTWSLGFVLWSKGYRYCIYCRPIGHIVCLDNLGYHCYADNTKPYVVNKKSCGKWPVSSSCIETCVEHQSVDTVESLETGGYKTEVIVFSQKWQWDGVCADLSLTKENSVIQSLCLCQKPWLLFWLSFGNRHSPVKPSEAVIFTCRTWVAFVDI